MSVRPSIPPDVLQATVERLHREWVAARGGREDIPEDVLDEIARVMLPAYRRRLAAEAAASKGRNGNGRPQ